MEADTSYDNLMHILTDQRGRLLNYCAGNPINMLDVVLCPQCIAECDTLLAAIKELRDFRVQMMHV